MLYQKWSPFANLVIYSLFNIVILQANTDVLGCRVNSDNTVTVVDGWNPTPNRSPNQLDNTQEGLCTYNTGYINGRISCL